MKLKLISLFLLAISLQSFAMEQGNKDWMKKEETAEINPSESLGDLSILPDEILIKIILHCTQGLDAEDLIKTMQAIEGTNKKFHNISFDELILAQHSLVLTPELTAELNSNLTYTNCKTIIRLIKHGADVNVTDNDGNTTLMLASMLATTWPDQYKNIIELLIPMKNIDINKINNNGSTPLTLAIATGNKDLVELLLTHKNIAIDAQNKDGITPLMEAVTWGYKDIVELLISKKANINATNRDNLTALTMATAWGNEDIAELLKQHGAHE